MIMYDLRQKLNMNMSDKLPDAVAALQFRFTSSIREILELHPDNRRRWDEMARREKAILFSSKTLEQVFEKAAPKGIKRYCYFVVLDQEQKLAVPLNAFGGGFFEN